MNEIKNVIICGLGAIGSIYADKINSHNPNMLKILADEKRIERYTKSPLVFNKKPLKLNYISSRNTGLKADLIIIATKNSGFSKALEDIKNFVKEDTIILSLLNGISSEEQIAKKYGREKVIYSYFVGHTSKRKGCEVTFDGKGEIVFGQIKENEQQDTSQKLAAIKELFDKAKINYSIPSDMEYSMWKKFLVNIGTNQASAVLRGSYKLFQNSQKSMNLALALMREGQAIAKAKGIKDTDKMLDEAVSIINSMLPQTKSSMLQDVEEGRKTEVEIFALKVIEEGKKYGIPTPYNEKIYEIISAIDDKLLFE